MPTRPSLNTVRSALQTAQAALQATSASPRLDAEVLLAYACKRDRAWLYANPQAPLSDNNATVFQALLGQRALGQPIAHLTGTREFWSLTLNVNEHTLVPRPETELLVDAALTHIAPGQTARVLDLGTGSGAIAIALAHERPECTVFATDHSAAALELAQQNAHTHCPGRICFLQGDWFAALNSGTEAFDVIVSNPPYIGEAERELTDPELAFEPISALFSGKDGLNDIRRIVNNAPDWLNRKGWLIVEHGFAQADAVATLLQTAGFDCIDNIPDLAGHPRVSYGQLL